MTKKQPKNPRYPLSKRTENVLLAFSSDVVIWRAGSLTAALFDFRERCVQRPPKDSEKLRRKVVRALVKIGFEKGALEIALIPR